LIRISGHAKPEHSPSNAKKGCTLVETNIEVEVPISMAASPIRITQALTLLVIQTIKLLPPMV
jgi:hypothetical protein